MLNLSNTRIHPLSEEVFDTIIALAGGGRAYPNHDKQNNANSDYVLGEAVIELKILDDEGLGKIPRQNKLAKLFSKKSRDRPVHVLDRNLLNLSEQREYDNIMGGPIKNAVKSSKKQLTQSRSDFPKTKRSILLLVNNANTALDHDEIVKIVRRRALNDTDKIDGVVVAGAYVHSDGFDSIILWPIDYVPIHLDNNFLEYGALKEAFSRYADRAMTSAMTGEQPDGMTKGPVLDSSFDVDERTFVKPAPPFKFESEFYVNGRPRLNSTGIETSPTVGITFPELSESEWRKFRRHMPQESILGTNYPDWLATRSKAISSETTLRPLVLMSITYDDWVANQNNSLLQSSYGSVANYANSLYLKVINEVLDGARDHENSNIIPSRYVLAVTEQIGQDEANDVSHIYLVEEQLSMEHRVSKIVQNLRIFHLYALSLAASYAVKYGVASLRWKKDQTYTWT